MRPPLKSHKITDNLDPMPNKGTSPQPYVFQFASTDAKKVVSKARELAAAGYTECNGCSISSGEFMVFGLVDSEFDWVVEWVDAAAPAGTLRHHPY